MISLCRLNLTKASVLFDIGSGTGSVAIEAAKLCPLIKVFAIEAEERAVELINQNIRHFNLNADDANIQVVHSLAPSGLEELPKPTHAFIGGTKGKLFEILSALYAKNSTLRIVMTAVTLETVSQLQTAVKKFPHANLDIVEVSISCAQKAGDYHILRAQNPVFICSFDFVS